MVSSMLTALVVVGCSALLAEAAWTDLRVNGVSDNKGDNFFYKQLPRTANEANDLGWRSPPEESKDSLTCNVPYTIMCPNSDPTLCLLFDKMGYVAGAEFGVVAFNAASVYPYAKKSSFSSKKRFGYDSFIATVFFVDQAVLNAGGRTSLTETGTGVWLQNGRNSMITVPMMEVDANTASGFVKQTCNDGVGVKYQYNLATSTLCEDTTPIVAVYQAGELAGFAFQAFGNVTPKGRSWADFTTTAAFTKSLATAPTCMGDWATTYGVVSVHVYFTATPWLNCCPVV